MQQSTRFALNAAAWFFVGKSDSEGAQENMPIKPPILIGRNSGADLRLPCSSVSGMHAEIFERNGELWVKDLRSTNGTFVNGIRIRSQNRLCENDTVQFGTLVFQISREHRSSQVSSLVANDNSEQDIEALQNERFERLFSGGVVPFFQPIISLSKNENELFGYEVLGRSRLFGLRTPAQMFATASRLEMEVELSRVLRNQGIKVADKNLETGQLLFVNTHQTELEYDGFENSLIEIRDNHPGRPIVLELHESVLNETERLLSIRKTLESMDIQLAFHDFGAGQVRLAELGEICPKVVKFDVQLTKGIDKAPSKRQQFVASLVKMVTDLGITPLAECVEQAGEHETIRQLGFQLGQGFYYGRPSSISDCRVSTPRIEQRVQVESVPMVKSFLDESPLEEVSEVEGTDAPNDSEWLLSQPENHYTIQVLSAISETRAQDYISTQDNPEQFAIFCKQGKTRMLYIVVCGVFEDRAAAKKASGNLADATISPWIRILSSVHAEIRTCNEA